LISHTKGRTQIEGLNVLPDVLRVIKTRMIRWAGHIARMENMRNSYKILVGEAGGKRLLGTPRRRLEDNIRMDLRQIWWEVVDCIYLAQVRDQWRALVNPFS
jgi:hypothetical protein